MRLIDADALLERILFSNAVLDISVTEVLDLITNAPTIQNKWPNGCNRTVPEALRYLAENPRPAYGNDSFNSEHLHQLANEIESAYAPTVQRDGWVIVPIEPTKEMQEAAIDNYNECPSCISWTGIYKAMIQAAPTDKE